MTELQWPPDVVGRLTVVQATCLAMEHAPGEPGSGMKKTLEGAMAQLAEQERAAAEWAGAEWAGAES